MFLRNTTNMTRTESKKYSPIDLYCIINEYSVKNQCENIENLLLKLFNEYTLDKIKIVIDLIENNKNINLTVNNYILNCCKTNNHEALEYLLDYRHFRDINNYHTFALDEIYKNKNYKMFTILIDFLYKCDYMKGLNIMRECQHITIFEDYNKDMLMFFIKKLDKESCDRLYKQSGNKLYLNK